MIDIPTIIRLWEADEPNYQKLGALTHKFIKTEITEMEISPLISYRTKEQLSIIKKIRTKQINDKTYDYDALKDKLGIRIVCNFNSDLDKIEKFIYKYFNVIGLPDRKKEKVRYDKLDYQSNHYDVQIKTEVPYFKKHAELKGFTFEIQVRTINQNAWADVAHSLIYKQESEIDDAIKRKIFRLIALYELADDEFNSINEYILSAPDNHVYSLLKKIEGKFYKLAKCEFDREYSVSNLKTILTFFSEEQKQHLNRDIESFITISEEKIKTIFDDNRIYFLSSPYLSQPEIFVIWYALEFFQFYITAKWLDYFDYQDLEDIANWWGLNIEQQF
jgi:putative GTP pyrophosphokinase